MSPAPAPELVGALLDGRYQVEALLGHGGMGAVYRAWHVHMEQRVAIKVLRPHLNGDPVAARRFAREARGTYQLDSEHAVKVIDFGATDAGLIYMVMEYLDGRTVADEVDVDGPMAPPRALSIAAQVCDALGAAHRLGFVHRDIKPDNIMLVRRGADPDVAKVLDFGLAKLIEGSGGNIFSVAALTQNDMVFGTPEYMAPEQAMGNALDGRADLYAIGATLFEMLTGRPPFVETSPMRLLAHHVKTTPPMLREALPELDAPVLEEIVRRCLAKDPAARPATAEALAAELRAVAVVASTPVRRAVPAAVAESATVELSPVAPEPPAPLRFAETVGVSPRTVGMRRSTRVTILAIGALAVALGVVVVFAMTRDPSKPAPEKTSMSASRSVVEVLVDATAPVAAPDAAAPAAAATVPDAAPARDAAVLRVKQPRDREPKAKPEKDPAIATHVSAAESARRSGNRLRQLAEAHAALDLEPGNTRARFLAGEALLETGDASRGCRYLRKARRLREARTLLDSGRCPID